MDKFRSSKGGYYEGDFSNDKKRLREKSLDIIDKFSGNNVGIWVQLRCTLESIFSKEQPSINQLKQDLKNNLK